MIGMGRAGRTRLGIFLLSLLAMSGGIGGASADTLDRIRKDHAIRIAYRPDAPPFSYENTPGKPGGFVVGLCQAVAKRIATQMGLPPLQVDYVSVTADNRFEAIQQGKADLLCEPTSSTLSRRKLVDFSVTTFVDGASLIITADGPQNLQALAGRTIGVLGGTTTEQTLRKSLADAGITADVIPAKSHAEGLALLDDRKISGYFADRSILLVLAANSKAPDRLRLADNYLTIETYALALPRGDDDFRLEVDRALSGIYGSGEIITILQQTFGSGFQMGPFLQTLYLISGLPE